MKIFFAITSIFISIILHSQEKTITGEVWNFENNEPLSYVNIGIKNKTVGTVSNNNGLFKLFLNDKVSSKDTIIFSYIGFKTKNIWFRN
ncbi:carboxypeptidase-like regulatory domain-containing protein [Algibacter lectus]|uniref:carboxypeptidase-like regulatory domain-containing protein n=1 Tax=Algibacter lectus TaxID=221126 RepID=UPI0005A600BB